MKPNFSLPALEGKFLYAASPALQLGFTVGSTLLFLLLSYFLFSVLSFGVAVFAILPVFAAAWFFSRWAGVGLSLGIALFTFVLARQVNPYESTLVQLGGALILFATLGLGSLITVWAKETRAQLEYEKQRRAQMETALKISNERYNMLFNQSGDAIFIYETSGRLLNVNDIASQRLGYTRQELLQMNIMEIATLDQAARLTKRMEELLEKKQILYESANVCKDGTVVPVELNSCLIERDGSPVVLSIARDITLRKNIERAEREQRALAEALREIAADLTSTLELEEVLDRILANLQQVVRHDSATIMLVEGGMVWVRRHQGYKERGLGEEMDNLKLPITDFPTLKAMYENQRPIVIPNILKSSEWKESSATYWVRSYAGAPLIFKGATIGFLNVESSYPGFFKNEHAERLLAIANHASVAIQNARLFSEVQRLAVVDELTGLFNRRGLYDLGQREVERAQRFKRSLAALLIDVDNFKSFNDEYSYAVGDEVLSTLAQRLKENVRRVDIVCRYGGDEFVILLAENNLETARIAAEHVHAAVNASPFQTSRGPLRVTISIGIATLKREDWDLPQLVEAAGQALHQAKLAGRDTIYEAQPQQ